jgi:hypothetical protein
MKTKKFAKPMMIIDQMGNHQDVLDYESFYDNLVKTYKMDVNSTDGRWKQTEAGVNVFLEQILSCFSEKKWFDVHNPVYKVTDDVMNKIKDIELPENIDSMLLPFSSYLVVFPKENFSFNMSKRGKQYIDGVLVACSKGSIDFTFYVHNKNSSYNFAEVISTDCPINQQIIRNKDDENYILEVLLADLIKKSLKIGYIASNEILTNEKEKVLITKTREREPNTTIITDIKYTDYKRFLKPVWDNMKSTATGVSKVLHYQFTRKAHIKTVRYGKGRMLSKVVEIAQTIVRPDLPRKAELMAA